MYMYYQNTRSVCHIVTGERFGDSKVVIRSR